MHPPLAPDLSHVSADDRWRCADPGRERGGEVSSPWGVHGRGGWGGGKMLKHMIRGWWTIGVCGSGVTKGGV